MSNSKKEALLMKEAAKKSGINKVRVIDTDWVSIKYNNNVVIGKRGDTESVFWASEDGKYHLITL